MSNDSDDSDDSAGRYAPFRADPGAYVAARAALDLEEVARGTATGEPVTVTARSLFLTRDVTVQVSAEPIYVAAERGFRLPDWRVDTYAGGLEISPALVARWADDDARVLDLAAGLSLFGSEASSLGFRVDCADAEFAGDHPMFAVAKRAVARTYADQLRFLRFLARHGEDARYRVAGDELILLDRLFSGRHATLANYPQPSGRRFVDDARQLATVPDDAYDAVLCAWLLVHLSEEDERRVVVAAVRVTRPGGEVRLRAGTGGQLAQRYETWFPGGEIGAKRAVIDPVSHDDLLVLRVEER